MAPLYSTHTIKRTHDELKAIDTVTSYLLFFKALLRLSPEIPEPACRVRPGSFYQPLWQRSVLPLKNFSRYTVEYFIYFSMFLRTSLSFYPYISWQVPLQLHTYWCNHCTNWIPPFDSLSSLLDWLKFPLGARLEQYATLAEWWFAWNKIEWLDPEPEPSTYGVLRGPVLLFSKLLGGPCPLLGSGQCTPPGYVFCLQRLPYLVKRPSLFLFRTLTIRVRGLRLAALRKYIVSTLVHLAMIVGVYDWLVQLIPFDWRRSNGLIHYLWPQRFRWAGMLTWQTLGIIGLTFHDSSLFSSTPWPSVPSHSLFPWDFLVHGEFSISSFIALTINVLGEQGIKKFHRGQSPTVDERCYKYLILWPLQK